MHTEIVTTVRDIERVLILVINEVDTARSPRYSLKRPFEKKFGPGIAGVENGKGAYLITARRFDPSSRTERNATIQIATQPPNETPSQQEPKIIKEIEDFLRKKGVRVRTAYMNDFSNSSLKPIVWTIVCYWG